MLGEWIARLMKILFKKDSVIVQKHEHDIEKDAGILATCTTPGLTEGAHCRSCGMVLVPQEEIPPVGHVPVVDEEIKPTCTESGKTEGSHCSACGEVLIPQEEIPSLGHDVVTDEAVKATCTSTGLTEGTHCCACGEVLKRQREIPALGHSVVFDLAVAASCTESGLTQGCHCSVCGKKLVAQKKIPPNGHRFKVIVSIPATCTKPGITGTSICEVCGAQPVKQRPIEPTGHKALVIKAVAPTCTKSGLTEGVHCSVCGEVLRSQEEIPALGHSSTIDDAVPATCTTPGLTEGAHCSVCGEVLRPQEEITALGHSITIDAAVLATCTTPGLTEGAHCSVCGEVLRLQETVPAVGHSVVVDAAVPAACTTPGLTEGAHCSVCGEVLRPQEEIPPLGHRITIDDAVPATCTTVGLTEGAHCSICGEVLRSQEEIPALGHSITIDDAVPATCTTPGLTEGAHCSVCGEILRPQEEITALGHSITIDAAVPATCTTPGLTEGTHCSVCGEVLCLQETVPVVGHSLVVDAAVPATCTIPGLTEGAHCSVCGVVLRPQEEIPPLGHRITIDDAVPATCTTVGLTEGEHCSICGEVLRQQEVIPALGHNVVVDDAVPATDTGTGLTEGSHCSVCGKVLVPQEEVPILKKRDAPVSDGEDWKVLIQPTTGCVKRDEVSLVAGSSKVPAKHIRTRAYQGRTDIHSIELPKETTHIDEAAFEGCIALKSVVIPENVRKIGEGAFKGCSALEKVVLPSALKEIPKSCFENCTNLRTVVTGTELRSVKMSAFQRCHSLHHLALPSSCWEISPSAFMGCKREQITLHVVQGSFAREYAKKHGFSIDEYTTIENYYEQETSLAEHGSPTPCAAGHVEVVEPSVPATCIKAGWTSEKHCRVCSIVMEPRLPIPALGHDAETISAIPAGCTTEGKTAGSRCRRCGEILQEQESIPALGHSVEIMPAVAATCNSEGCALWVRCRRCGAVLKEKIVIPALEHDVETIPGWPATKTSSGMTEGKKCRRCGRILSEQTAIPRLRDQSSTADRLQTLASKPAAEWPLNRMLAFGATTQEYEALQDKFSDEFFVNLDVLDSPKCQDSDRKWVGRIDEDAWDRAIKLCTAITRIGTEHADGLRIARQRLLGAKDDQIARALRCSPMELRREYNGYVNAVTDLFHRHSQALDFMYPHGFFDRTIAETFFGGTTFDRIERCCDMVRIHELRGYRQAKPVGLTASLKTEASNHRTKVLTEWEHLKNYIVEQFDSQPILGSIELDDKEYGMLIDYLNRAYMTKARSCTGMDVDKVVCVALVQIALRCTGAAYWPVVAKTLGIAQTPEMSTTLGKCFLRTMKRFKKATFATSEYVASIKLHTFVINAYISRLFEFLFLYYELDLGRNLEFANLEELRSLMISGGYFSRKQMLLQQTIDALKLIPEASLNRLKTYLGWIDSAFWQQGWQPDHEDRFSRAFKQWCASKDEFTGGWTASDSGRRRGKRMHSRPTLNLDVRNGQFNLILPVQRLPFDCDNLAGWRIVDGDGRRYNLVCTLVESITGCRTDELTQEISKNGLLNEITLEFYNGSKTIRNYTIPGDCVRIFNSQGLMVTGKRVPSGRMYFLTHPGADVETESEGIRQKFGPWNLQVVELQEGEAVIFPDATLAVVGSDVTEGVCGGRPVMGARVHRKESDKCYHVYGQFPSFLLKVTEDQFARTRFQINDRYLTAKEVRCRRLTLHERTADTGYLVTIPSPHEDYQLCHININVPGDGHARDWTFCYWPDFSYSFDNGKHALPYWDSPRGAVRVRTSIPMRGEGVEKNPNGSGEYGFLINAEPEPLSLDFDWNGESWALDLEVPALAWRQGNEPWQMTPLGEVWHKDFPKAVDIRTQANEVWLYVDRDGLKNGQSVSFKRRKDEDYVHCDLLALRQWFTRDRIMHSVHLHIDGKDFDFASAYCRSYLASGRIEAHYANYELHGSFEIIGRGSYSVTLLHEQKEILTQVPVVDGEFTARAPLKSGLYTAIVYEEVEDEFGFDVTWDEIGRENVKLLNPGDLTGASMAIKHLDTLNEQPEELALRPDCYHIKLTARAEGEGVAYTGEIKDFFGSLKPNLTVYVEYPDLDAIDHCRIHFREDDEWVPFLYDYSQKRIVTQENRKMPFMERYRRYVALVPEDTFTVVYETN